MNGNMKYMTQNWSNTCPPLQTFSEIRQSVYVCETVACLYPVRGDVLLSLSGQRLLGLRVLFRQRAMEIRLQPTPKKPDVGVWWGKPNRRLRRSLPFLLNIESLGSKSLLQSLRYRLPQATRFYSPDRGSSRRLSSQLVRRSQSVVAYVSLSGSKTEHRAVCMLRHTSKQSVIPEPTSFGRKDL